MLPHTTSESAQDAWICVDRVLPNEEEQKAQERAAAANPRNLIPRERLDPLTRETIGIGFEFRKCWAVGTELQVRFLDGEPEVQRRVAEIAQEWTLYANIKLLFNNSPQAQIRISFAQQGAWSWVGLDALAVPLDQPTMNLGLLLPSTPPERYNSVVLHEWGHALGAIHEHQNPHAGIPWDRDKVIAYYQGPPNFWDERKILRNVLDKYDEEHINASDFDPYSIMLYPVSAALTRHGFTIPWRNNALSEMDKKWASLMYPY